MPVFIGLDIGSSSVRAVAFNEGLVPLHAAQRQYPMYFPKPGWAEQDPYLILSCTLSVLTETAQSLKEKGILKELKGIGASGFMHSSMAVGLDREPLTSLLPWADQRTAAQVQRFRREYNGREIYNRTGCPVHTTYVPCKISWFRESMPELDKSTWRYMSAKEWVLGRLTNNYVTDLGIASGSGLMNMQTKDFDEIALRCAGIGREMLNPLMEPDTMMGMITPDISRITGIPHDTPVIVGSSDAAMSSLGSGAAGIGETAAMIGTSGAIRMASDRPLTDIGMKCWCYYLAQGKWIFGGATNNGGNILSWFKDLLVEAYGEIGGRSELSYENLIKLAGESPAGAKGLLFLAFLAGERAPGWNENARGALLGLTLSHKAEDVARSILEGTVYQLEGVYEALKRQGMCSGRIVATGGFAKSDLWLRIMAAVLNTDIEVPLSFEGSSAGAAAMAMVGVGYKEGLEWTSLVRRGARIIRPDVREAARYVEILKVYYKAYEALGKTCEELVRIA